MVTSSPSHPTRTNSVNQPSPVLPARLAQLPVSRSTIDTTKVDLDNRENQDLSNRPTRSSSLALSPSAVSNPPWHDQPRIFPGLVHEQTRRTSTRSGNDSENIPASLTEGGLNWSVDIDGRNHRGQRAPQRSVHDVDADDVDGNNQTAEHDAASDTA